MFIAFKFPSMTTHTHTLYELHNIQKIENILPNPCVLAKYRKKRTVGQISGIFASWFDHYMSIN